MATQRITIDMAGKSMGRVATQVATLLMGKGTAAYRRNMVDGSPIITIEHIKEAKFTGRKLSQNVYHYHTGYIGHLKTLRASELFEKKPSDLFVRIVRGMMPKNNQRDRLLRNIKFI